jgi:hypothetical protein
MKNKSIFLILLFLISTVFILISPRVSNASSLDATCSNVEMIFARGSGQKLDEQEKKEYFNRIGDRLSTVPSITFSKYELGTESYGGYQYPAVSVSSYDTAMGAAVSGGQSYAYGDSVDQGIGELVSYITQRNNKCGASGIHFILGGYSQGAQVIGQALPKIAKGIRDKIVFAGLFGDPKLNLPEGFGWNPPACQGKDHSPWRRFESNCAMSAGILGARSPYLPDDMASKTGLWCNDHDSICDFHLPYEDSSHGRYAETNMAIDTAAREAVERLEKALPAGTTSTINTKPAAGQGTTGSDTAFVINTTAWMGDILEQTKASVADQAAKIVKAGGRVGLVAFRDQSDAYTAEVEASFTDSLDVFNDKLNRLQAIDGRDYPQAVLHGLMTAFDGLSWQKGATKSAIVITNSTYHDPDIVDGSTLDTVVKRSFEIDPVNIYPVIADDVTQYADDSGYVNMATETSGQVLRFTVNHDNNTSNLATIMGAVTSKIQSRPVAFLKNAEYKARPGQEITLDASDSYVIDANITKYEWDFNGDGIFDASTTTPSINHTYTGEFSGIAQVRVSADNDTIASATAKITIANTTAPPPVSPAKNLIANVEQTTNNVSTATISWQAAAGIDKWLVRLNDTPLGYVTGDRSSFDLTDIDRTKDTTVSVTAIRSDGAQSAETTVTIKSLTSSPSPTPTTTPAPTPSPSPSPTPTPTPTPKPSTCTQSFFLIKVVCTVVVTVKSLVLSIF